MAELAAIATIVGIAASGAKISMHLYALGSTIGSAKGDVTKVAVNIATFCSVLQQLASTLEKARSARFSISAIATTQEILDRCQELFGEIEDVVDKLRSPQKGGQDPKQTSIGNVARVKWVFKRLKMKKIRAELESMKLTLSLMLTTLNFADRIAKRRESGIPSFQAARDEDEEIESVAASLLVAQQCVEDELEDLEALEEETEDEGIAREKGVALHLSQSEDYFHRGSNQRQSFRGSMAMVDSSTSGLDFLNRPKTWTEGQTASDTRQLFINLLKRWANCEAQLPVRQPLLAQVSKEDEPSLVSPSTSVPGLVQEFRHSIQKSSIETYIKVEIKAFEDNDDEEKRHGLDLCNRSLNVVPQEVFDVGSEVSRLALAHNQLRTFTVPVKTFTKLRYLSLSHNKLGMLHSSITDIRTLEHLDLSRNRLESLPDSLANLKQLKVRALCSYIMGQ